MITVNRHAGEIRVDSPYLRRLRLARDLVELREQKRLSQMELARACGFASRFRIQRIENADTRPNLNDVLAVVEQLGVAEETPRWLELQRTARDAARRGWWDEKAYKLMGDRQKRHADLELGANIKVYDYGLIPGLLQTEAYYRELTMASGVTAVDASFDPEVGVKGRLARQRQFHEGHGTLLVVLEEMAVRHQFVEPATMREQLEHLASVADTDRIQVRVIPTEAILRGVRPPRTPFIVFSYDEDRDPLVVLLEGIEDDNIQIGDRAQRYADLHHRLADAALSPSDSATYFADAARKVAT